MGRDVVFFSMLMDGELDSGFGVLGLLVAS